MRHHYGSSEDVTFTTTVNLTVLDDDGEAVDGDEDPDVEVTVEATVTGATPPTIRMDPGECDPGDSGEVEITAITRTDTGDDVMSRLAPGEWTSLEERAQEEASEQAEAAYEDAKESAAEARAEMRAERERDGEDW